MRSGGALIFVFCLAFLLSLMAIWGSQVWDHFVKPAYTVVKDR